MPWAKLDDQILDNQKITKVGTLGFALHVAAITWASRNLTDGYVPDSKVRLLLDFGDLFARTSPERSEKFAPCDGLEVAGRLVEAGLWELSEGGFLIHDYLKYNPSKAQVIAEREKARERMARLRNTNEGGSEDVRPNFGRSSDAPVTRNPLPVTPLSPNPDSLLVQASQPERTDTLELCQRMVELNEERNAKPKTITQAWLREARLLLDRDGRSLGEALSLLEWAAYDSFWGPNILSIPKFREKYDQLRGKRERSNGNAHSSAFREGIPSEEELNEVNARLRGVNT